MTLVKEYLRRAKGTSPRAMLRWFGRRGRERLDERLLPAMVRRLDETNLLSLLDASELDELWRQIASRPLFVPPAAVAPEVPVEPLRKRAARARRLEVDFLGSGPSALSFPINWRTDFKSGHTWPLAPPSTLSVLDLKNPSDIKVPWELSRLQWLLPLGQAYALDGDDADAELIRRVIEDWDDANPICRGPNWACTMDVALRAISLVWLFHACHGSPAWNNRGFRFRFLRLLFVHGVFTRRHLEWSSINGNHLTSNLAGLVVIGLFFSCGKQPMGWLATGWQHLCSELPRQVPADGVTFEASVPYHRLVLELFALPALCRLNRGLPVAEAYIDRLAAMALFTAAYCRDDGSVPNWGDADDGRALPLGGQPTGDHGYLLELIGRGFGRDELPRAPRGDRSEVYWWLGSSADSKHFSDFASQSFAKSGVHIMRGPCDHLFIDCGPVGMAGRGGHGHNDCLSFEARLNSVSLIGDPGCYVYSADMEARNTFRATASHNTPQLDGAEINRFVDRQYLWTLRDDAKPQVRLWEPALGDGWDRFVGSHSGYQRLHPAATPVRGIALDKAKHRLIITDRIEGEGSHFVRVPLHFMPDVTVAKISKGVWGLSGGGKKFLLAIGEVGDWQTTIEDGWYSPSYGVKRKSLTLVFIREGTLAPLTVGIVPVSGAAADLPRWLREMAHELFLGVLS